MRWAVRALVAVALLASCGREPPTTVVAGGSPDATVPTAPASVPAGPEAPRPPATTGPVTTGPATTGPVTSAPATTGPVTPGPLTTGPVTPAASPPPETSGRPGGDEAGACAVAAPVDAAAYQAVFDARTPAWQGADLTGVVELDDGRRLWLFGDTWVGPLGPGGQPGPDTRLVSSSAFAQRDGCFERLGPPGEAYLPAPDGGGWYWPSGGWVDAGRVVVVASRVVPAGEGPFAFAPAGQALVLVDPEVLLPDTVAPFVLAERVPGVLWGDASVEVGTLRYVFGHAGGDVHLARTARGATVEGPWEVWDGAGFTASAERAAPLTRPGSIETRPSVVRRDGGFLMVAKVDTMLTDGVHAWWAPVVTAPWLDAGLIVATTPVGPTEISYMATVIDDPVAGLLVLWNVLDLEPATADVRAYGPRVAPAAPVSW